MQSSDQGPDKSTNNIKININFYNLCTHFCSLPLIILLNIFICVNVLDLGNKLKGIPHIILFEMTHKKL